MSRGTRLVFYGVALGALAIFAEPALRLASHLSGAPKAIAASQGDVRISPTSALQPTGLRPAQKPVASKPPLAPSVELPDSSVPLDQAVTRLQALADSGNTAAQRALTSHLNACTQRALRAAASSDETDRLILEDDKQNKNLDEQLRTTRLQNVQYRLDVNARIREACAKLSPDLMAHWLDPLDRAAQTGDIAAMREYASLAIADYESVQSVVADVDSAIVRRDKARAYLLKALELGDKDSLAELANAYFNTPDATPRLFEVDPFQAYVYAYAATLVGNLPSRNGLDEIMSQSAKALDAKQIIIAQNQGRQIYEQCCSSQ